MSGHAERGRAPVGAAALVRYWLCCGVGGRGCRQIQSDPHFRQAAPLDDLRGATQSTGAGSRGELKGSMRCAAARGDHSGKRPLTISVASASTEVRHWHRRFPICLRCALGCLGEVPTGSYAGRTVIHVAPRIRQRAKQHKLCNICSVRWLWEPVLQVNEIGFEFWRIGVFGITLNIAEPEPLVDR